MDFIFSTPRLRLRRFGLDDAPFIIELLNTEGWLRFIGDRNVHTTGDALAYLEKGPFQSYEKNGFGLWMVERSDGIPLGMCGLVVRDYLDHPDIGFAFLPQHCALGYGYEAAAGTLHYAKEGLNIDAVYAITVPENTASQNLIIKLGFSFHRRQNLPDTNETLMVYFKMLGDN